MSGYREIRREDGCNFKELDHDVKHVLKWSWLEGKYLSNTFLSEYMRKVNISGKILRNICSTL